MVNGADQSFSASDEALQTISNHHPLANGQSTLPRGWSPASKHKTPRKRIVGSYTSRNLDTSNDDIENFPSHNSWPNAQATQPRGWPPTGKHETPTKAAIMPYSSLSTRVKTVNAGFRREASKSHGDLSNLRPKSPIQSLFSPPQHESSHPYDSTANELHEAGKVHSGAPSMASPSFNWQINRQARSSGWMSTVLNARSLRAPMTNQAVGYESRQLSFLPRSEEGSCLSEEVPVAIPIQGLDSGIFNPLDFCIPATRLHPHNLKHHGEMLPGDTHITPLVEQIYVTNTWLGIQWPEAAELFRIHKAFIETLERMLANELRQISLQVLQKQCISPTLNSPTTAVVRGISFCREQLVSEMAEVLYSSEQDMEKSQAGLFRMYLAASDCLVQFEGDGSRDTSITVRVSCRPRDTPTVEAAWVPDTLSFKDLHESPREGQEFCLIPQYHSKTAFNSTRTPTNIRYSIELKQVPLSWLSWDDEIAGFKGIVPLYSQDPDSRGRFRNLPRTFRDDPYDALKTLQFDVKAVLIDDNGSSVVYERVLCSRLIVRVLPWYTQDAAHSLGGPIQACPHHSREVAVTVPYSSPGFDDHTPLIGQNPSIQRAEKVADTYAKELHGHGQHTLEGRGRDQVPASLSAVTAATKPSDLAALAEIYAHLATNYAELARYHQLLEMQAESLGPRQPFALKQQHEQDAQACHTDNAKLDRSVSPQSGSQRFASTSSMSSLLAKYTAGLLPDQALPFAVGRNAAQDQSTSADFNILSNLPPSQTFNEPDRTRVLVPLEMPSHVDPNKPATPTKREVVPALTVTPPALVTPTTYVQDEPTPKASEQGSRKRHATSSMSQSSPLKKIKEWQQKLQEVKNTVGAGKSSFNVAESDSDKVIPSPALVPGIMCYNSFAPLAQQECENLNISSEDGEHSASHPKEDDPHHRVESGYYVDIASFACLPTPAASSNGGSRATSGSVDIDSGSDDHDHKIALHEQAVLWNLLSKVEDSEKENKAEAKIKEVRLSADEKKALDDAMQRSVDEIVGKFDDIFNESEELDSGVDISTESEEL